MGSSPRFGGATAAAANLSERRARPDVVAEAETLVDHAHAEAVEAFLAANGMEAADITVIGFHGQTVLHRPERRLTVQLGDGAVQRLPLVPAGQVAA